MKKLEFEVRFMTPAFLGNAEQSGQWRTPPFKALLRQWWRVAYAADHQFAFNLADMRREEGSLFGHAWLENDTFERNGREISTAARKSKLRIRLDYWDEGQLKQWPGPDSVVQHPEVKQNQGNVGSSLYLGFGPLRFQAGTALKSNAAIQSGSQAKLSIAAPDVNASRIERALWLMDRYGTLGGRSRNGWGSFALLPLSPGEGWGEGALPLRPWRDCLNLDWPHAIGQDDQGRPLIWQSRAFDDWKSLMRELAIVKIGLRTQFKFTTGQNAPYPEARHWLSHPITKHNVGAWRQARLPNSLRFKIRALSDGKLAGVIFHVPCLPPKEFNPDPAAIQDVWRRVHGFLDAPAQNLTRTPE